MNGSPHRGFYSVIYPKYPPESRGLRAEIFRTHARTKEYATRDESNGVPIENAIHRKGVLAS